MEHTYLIAAAWMALALVASLVSIRLGISVALIEMGMGVIGGNFLGARAVGVWPTARAFGMPA